MASDLSVLNKIRMPKGQSYEEHTRAAQSFLSHKLFSTLAVTSNLLAFREFNQAADNAPDKAKKREATINAFKAAFRGGEIAYNIAAQAHASNDCRTVVAKYLMYSEHLFTLAHRHAIDSRLDNGLISKAHKQMDDVNWVLKEFNGYLR